MTHILSIQALEIWNGIPITQMGEVRFVKQLIRKRIHRQLGDPLIKKRLLTLEPNGMVYALEGKQAPRGLAVAGPAASIVFLPANR